MLISADASACHRFCIHRKLLAIDVEAVLVLREDNGKARLTLLQTLQVDRLVDWWPGLGRMFWVRMRICTVLILAGPLRTGLSQIRQHHSWIGVPGRTRIY